MWKEDSYFRKCAEENAKAGGRMSLKQYLRNEEQDRRSEQVR